MEAAVLLPIHKIWSQDQKALSWVTTMEWVDPRRLWPMREAIQCIKILGDTSLHCRYKWTGVLISNHTSTQLAPMVSPRHFATAPAPPATEQFGHCPKVIILDPQRSYFLGSSTKLFSQAREGPALSCNFCWNTTDGSGRILRRKTKYHCPECQTNLCIGNSKIFAVRIWKSLFLQLSEDVVTSIAPVTRPVKKSVTSSPQCRASNSITRRWRTRTQWSSSDRGVSSYSTDMTLNHPLKGFIS